MSRTYRNNPIRNRSVFLVATTWIGRRVSGAEKVLPSRVATASLGMSVTSFATKKHLVRRCRCEDYCIPGKLHKHLKSPLFIGK